MDTKLIEEKNNKYLNHNKMRRMCYRIPTVVIFLVAIICKEIGGWIVGIVWTLISEFFFAVLTKNEKAIDKLVRKKEYILKEDVITNIYSEYSNPHPRIDDDEHYDRGTLYNYIAFENIDVKYSGNDANMYEVGEKVILQVVTYRGKNNIINIFKKTEDTE